MIRTIFADQSCMYTFLIWFVCIQDMYFNTFVKTSSTSVRYGNRLIYGIAFLFLPTFYSTRCKYNLPWYVIQRRIQKEGPLFVDPLIHQFSRLLMEIKTKMYPNFFCFYHFCVSKGGPRPPTPWIRPCYIILIKSLHAHLLHCLHLQMGKGIYYSKII